MTYLKRFIHEDQGQDMVEYGLLAAFISIVAILIIQTVGERVQIVFQKIQDALPSS